MKEATGELNMTVITVVAICAVGLLFYTFIWPMIQGRIVQTTCDTMGQGYTAEQAKEGACAKDCFQASSDDAGGASWCCCPPQN